MSGVRHGVGIAVLAALLVACVFYPFLPGEHDRLGVTVSAMAQFAGFGGLLLVPVGAAWLVHEARRGWARRLLSGKDRGYLFAILSLCVAALVAGLGSLLAFVGSSKTLGIAAFALSACAVRRAARGIGRLKRAQERPFHPAPAYLVLVPLAVVGSRWLFLEAAVASGRNRAIQNSAELIGEIEAFRAERGHYPQSLAGLHKDYSPGVLGVPQYEYAQRGAGYSVFFELPAVPIGTREVVMYNPRDEHALPSHDSDVLRWTPEQQAARPGHYALLDAPVPHWKYFWFD